FAAPPVQTPAWQVSPMLQKSPSSQATPSLTGVDLQPVPGSQLPTVQAVSKNVQSGGTPPPHTPFAQNPLSTQLVKSVHAAPLLPGISMHLSCAMSQTAV